MNSRTSKGVFDIWSVQRSSSDESLPIRYCVTPGSTEIAADKVFSKKPMSNPFCGCLQSFLRFSSTEIVSTGLCLLHFPLPRGRLPFRRRVCFRFFSTEVNDSRSRHKRFQGRRRSPKVDEHGSGPILAAQNVGEESDGSEKVRGAYVRGLTC